jgi:hypothetical protein
MEPSSEPVTTRAPSGVVQRAEKMQKRLFVCPCICVCMRVCVSVCGKGRRESVCGKGKERECAYSHAWCTGMVTVSACTTAAAALLTLYRLIAWPFSKSHRRMVLSRDPERMYLPVRGWQEQVVWLERAGQGRGEAERHGMVCHGRRRVKG